MRTSTQHTAHSTQLRLKAQGSRLKACCPRVQPSAFSLQPRAAFTLVELMLVIVIIGVLAAMVVPRLTGRTEQAKIARAKSDLAAIGLAADLYELDTGRLPASLEDLTRRDAPADLSDDTKGRWNGPYLKKGLPNDPWSKPYSYSRESQHNQDYDLFSLGPDGQPGNDDVTNWE